jgi:hypothetical protein
VQDFVEIGEFAVCSFWINHENLQFCNLRTGTPKKVANML